MRKPLPSDQIERLEKLKDTQEDLARQWQDYWQDYSSFDSWQFWVNLSFIVIPLIILFFTIDRRKIFLLGFFGFNIHVWGVYLDAVATRNNFLEYPFKAIPFLPFHVGIDTSLVPVLFILLYQWTLNQNRNFYIYSLLLIAFISFIVRPITVLHHLLHLKNGANYLHIFIGYILVTLVSIGITNIFRYLHMKKQPII